MDLMISSRYLPDSIAVHNVGLTCSPGTNMQGRNILKGMWQQSPPSGAQKIEMQGDKSNKFMRRSSELNTIKGPLHAIFGFNWKRRCIKALPGPGQVSHLKFDHTAVSLISNIYHALFRMPKWVGLHKHAEDERPYVNHQPLSRRSKPSLASSYFSSLLQRTNPYLISATIWHP